MEEGKKSESHLTSAAAFVEGGIQDVCDDACSICLEQFWESDPSTVTSCKHEFHLQCVLEWCQRSSQCPMCWQSLSLKDPASQELLEGVEHERNFRLNQVRNTTIFHHPPLGDFELQHLPVGANDSDLEERIIQHLAAASAMGGTHHIARREGHWSRGGSHGRTQFLVFSTHPNAPTVGLLSAIQRTGISESSPTVALLTPTSSLSAVGGDPLQTGISHAPSSQVDQVPVSTVETPTNTVNGSITFSNRIGSGQSSPVRQDQAGPSDFHSLSESLKSRLNAVSTRYKETISKTAKGWRERLFSRNTSFQDSGSEIRRDISPGIASVTRMMARLQSRENDTPSAASMSIRNEGSLVIPSDPRNGDLPSTSTAGSLNAGTHASVPDPH